VITVSQYYPVADVAAFEVGPRTRGAAQTSRIELPKIQWSMEDLLLLRSLPFEVPHAILDLCSATPDEWVGSTDAYERAGVERKSGTGKVAGFGYAVRTRFGRGNPPWNTSWAEGGVSQQYYRVGKETADLWLGVQEAHPLDDMTNQT
jgi:hypothetical protein